MDAVQLVQLLTIGACLYAAARFGLGSLDRAEAVFASLFVPPDRTLGWPRGVQESDAPWGWQPPINPLVDDAAGSEAVTELAAEPPAVLLSGHSSYVERPHRVDPVHVRTLPQ